jgi:dinuclear metal center YbgI/SA1388 family protein
MVTIDAIAAFLERFAPPRLAEAWDNVGLLVGDGTREVRRVMTCLTITPASAAEAIRADAELIVTHHPLPFRALRRLTTDDHTGRLLWDLITARIGVYSPHTAWDSAPEGINQRLAAALQLQDIVPLSTGDGDRAVGRRGSLAQPCTLAELAARMKRFLGIARLQIVGANGQRVAHVAVACGAADEMLAAARTAGCDAMLLGEARFHTCLEAEAAGIGLVLPGHFASERFSLERLAEVLAGEFPQLDIWASREERDPLRWIE